jgi:hypothetical protein
MMHTSAGNSLSDWNADCWDPRLKVSGVPLLSSIALALPLERRLAPQTLQEAHVTRHLTEHAVLCTLCVCLQEQLVKCVEWLRGRDRRLQRVGGAVLSHSVLAPQFSILIQIM